MMLTENEICRRLSEVAEKAINGSALWRSLLLPGGGPPYHSLAEFRDRVPQVDKQILFSKARKQVSDALVGGDLASVAQVLPSSGTSGGSLGLSFLSRLDAETLATTIDGYLDEAFQIRTLPTLVLSALPGGVRVPTTAALSLYAGVRPDLAHRMLERLATQYSQVVIVAEPLYAKRLLEYLHRRGYPLRRQRIHLAVGGYYLPENLRDYLAWLLGIRLDERTYDPRRILSTFGMGEVGLNLLYETPETVSLRRWLRDRPRMVGYLCGTDLPTVPLLFRHDASRVYVENEDQRLVFTMLEPDRLQPVIRYDSGDWGGFVPHWKLREEIPKDRLDLLPDDGSDLVWVYGRYSAVWKATGYLTEPRIQEALFRQAVPVSRTGQDAAADDAAREDGSSWRILASITGFFALGKDRQRPVASERREVPLVREWVLDVQMQRPPDARPGQASRGFVHYREAQEIEPATEERVRRVLLGDLDAVLGTVDEVQTDPSDAAGSDAHPPGSGRGDAKGAFSGVAALGLVPFQEWDGHDLELLYDAKPRPWAAVPNVRRAFTEQDKKRIYELRHTVFVLEEELPYEVLGTMAAARSVRDEADAGAVHFLAEVGGQVVGAVRVVTDYERFEDKHEFGIKDWVLTPEEEEQYIPRPAEFLVDQPLPPRPPRYGVFFARRALAQVGRVCVARAWRGGGHNIGERLLGAAIRYLARAGVAAVFMDCRATHLQRYQSFGFLEYQPPYIHPRLGIRYHTMLAPVSGMQNRWEDLRARGDAAWREAWETVIRMAHREQPATLRTTQDSIAWSFLLEKARNDASCHPARPDTDLLGAVTRWSREPPRLDAAEAAELARAWDGLLDGIVVALSESQGRPVSEERLDPCEHSLPWSTRVALDVGRRSCAAAPTLAWALMEAAILNRTVTSESGAPGGQGGLPRDGESVDAADGAGAATAPPRIPWNLPPGNEVPDIIAAGTNPVLQRMLTPRRRRGEAGPPVPLLADLYARVRRKAADFMPPELALSLGMLLEYDRALATAIRAGLLDPELLKRRDAAHETLLAHVSQDVGLTLVDNPLRRRAERLFLPTPAPAPAPQHLDERSGAAPPGRDSRVGAGPTRGPGAHGRSCQTSWADAPELSRLDQAFDSLDGGVFVTRQGKIAFVTAGHLGLAPTFDADASYDAKAVALAEPGHTIGAPAALCGARMTFRVDRASPDLRLRLVDAGLPQYAGRREPWSPGLRALREDPGLSLALARQLVRDFRNRARSGAPRLRRFEFAIPPRLVRDLSAGLPRDVFDYLAEGLQPVWRVAGSVLCRRGDFADRVWLVDQGVVHAVGEREEPPLASTWEEIRDERYAHDDGSACGRQRIVGFWGALLPLDDPFFKPRTARVPERRSLRPQPEPDDGRNRLPVQGVAEGEARRGPQPQRYDVTAIVGRHNAGLYELSREEFLARLEEWPEAMFHVCVEVARGIVLMNLDPQAQNANTTPQETMPVSGPPAPEPG